MRLAVLRAPQRFEIEDVPAPEPGAGEVLVDVAGSGVCASELETWTTGLPGGEPWYPGHEVSGVVAALGPEVDGLSVGERVGVWVTERGYAEQVAVRADRCFPAGDGPLDAVLAEPLACALNAVELADVRLGDDVVVIGAGFMGQLVQRLVALRGPRSVVVVDVREDARARAAAAGATRVVDPTHEELPTDADVTFECTGTQTALVSCGETTRMSGKIAIVGFHQGEVREVPLGYWNWMAFTILNAHFRDLPTIMRGMDAGSRLVSSGVLSLDALVTHRFPLERIDEAFATLRDKPPGFVKAVISFPEGEGG
jgi:2-desacetyl-2-hydroxyethyl bacteriochlorophyllide A dehydrogenase